MTFPKHGCQLQAARVVAAGRQLLQAPATQRIGARPLAVPGQAQATESRLDLGKGSVMRKSLG